MGRTISGSSMQTWDRSGRMNAHPSKPFPVYFLSSILSSSLQNKIYILYKSVDERKLKINHQKYAYCAFSLGLLAPIRTVIFEIFAKIFFNNL